MQLCRVLFLSLFVNTPFFRTRLVLFVLSFVKKGYCSTACIPFFFNTSVHYVVRMRIYRRKSNREHLLYRRKLFVVLAYTTGVLREIFVGVVYVVNVCCHHHDIRIQDKRTRRCQHEVYLCGHCGPAVQLQVILFL